MDKKRIVFVLILAVLVLVISITIYGGSRVVDKRLCEDSGGRWMNVGNSPYQRSICNDATSDGGQTCIDSDECESSCQARQGAQAGEVGEGACYGFIYSLDGCGQRVEKGIVQREICQ